MSDTYKPYIVVIYCGQSLADSEHIPEGTREGDNFDSRFVMMPCSSKIETRYLVKLVEKGNDGIVLVACPGKQCRFTVGSARAEHRISHAQSLLGEVGIGADRISIVRRAGLSVEDIFKIAADQAEKVRPLGQNPMKNTG